MGKTLEELTYCGADCEECNIYRVTQYGEALKPETLRRWREDAQKFWGLETLEADQLNCRGCRGDKKDVFFLFTACPLRKCCIERKLKSCGDCPDWQTCGFYETPEDKARIKKLVETGKNN